MDWDRSGCVLDIVGNLIYLTYTDFAFGDAKYIKLLFALAHARATSDAAAYEQARVTARKQEKLLASGTTTPTTDELEGKSE